MIRTVFCAVALFGFSSFARADPSGQASGTKQDVSTRGSHETRPTPPAHVPSSGLTMEALQALPPDPNAWFPPRPANQRWVYQPYNTYYTGVYPYYSYPYSSYSYPFGVGGYYPPRVGGYYPSTIGWWWFR